MIKDAIYDQLTEGVHTVIVRLSRRDNEEGNAPEWKDPEEVQLVVQRRKKTIRNHKTVELLLVSLISKNWAEYSEQCYCGNGEFESEGWRMQISSFLDGPTPPSPPAQISGRCLTEQEQQDWRRGITPLWVFNPAHDPRFEDLQENLGD